MQLIFLICGYNLEIYSHEHRLWIANWICPMLDAYMVCRVEFNFNDSYLRSTLCASHIHSKLAVASSYLRKIQQDLFEVIFRSFRNPSQRALRETKHRDYFDKVRCIVCTVYVHNVQTIANLICTMLNAHWILHISNIYEWKYWIIICITYMKWNWRFGSILWNSIQCSNVKAYVKHWLITVFSFIVVYGFPCMICFWFSLSKKLIQMEIVFGIKCVLLWDFKSHS